MPVERRIRTAPTHQSVVSVHEPMDFGPVRTAVLDDRWEIHPVESRRSREPRHVTYFCWGLSFGLPWSNGCPFVSWEQADDNVVLAGR